MWGPGTGLCSQLSFRPTLALGPQPPPPPPWLAGEGQPNTQRHSIHVKTCTLSPEAPCSEEGGDSRDHMGAEESSLPKPCIPQFIRNFWMHTVRGMLQGHQRAHLQGLLFSETWVPLCPHFREFNWRKAECRGKPQPGELPLSPFTAWGLSQRGRACPRLPGTEWPSAVGAGGGRCQCGPQPLQHG